MVLFANLIIKPDDRQAARLAAVAVGTDNAVLCGGFWHHIKVRFDVRLPDYFLRAGFFVVRVAFFFAILVSLLYCWQSPECELVKGWMDFKPHTCELSIHHTLYKGKLKEPKTESSKTIIRVALQIAALLLSHQENSDFQAMDDFIFCRKNGDTLEPNVVRKNLYKAMDKAKIQRVTGKYGLHIFRHSAGILLYEKSRDLKLVQGALRHSDISTPSDIYVHLGEEVLREGNASVISSKTIFWPLFESTFPLSPFVSTRHLLQTTFKTYN